MIEARSLNKNYGRREVVRDVSFTCAPGTITGFLGPNGAGKTTTMKMLIGLVRPTSGAATVGGSDYRSLPAPARVLGASLDASALHPGRSVRETLRLAALSIGVAPARADEIVHFVGLGGAESRPVRALSLGMRQRLSIGVALLGDPRALILDEPMNGLDPEGMAWIRRILRRSAESGVCVLLSSHLLSEVSSLADHYVIMNQGRVVRQGPASAVLNQQQRTIVGAQRPELLREALQQTDLRFDERSDGFVVHAPAEALGQLAVDRGIVLTRLSSDPAEELEEVFFASTGESADGEAELMEVEQR